MWWHCTGNGALTLQLQSFLHTTQLQADRGSGRARTRQGVSNISPPVLLTRVMSTMHS